MIRTLSEKEFVVENGEQHYRELCNACYKWMKDSPEYKKNLPELFSMMMFDWQFNDGRVGHIIIEATIKKLQRRKIGDITVSPDDFGIVSLKLTDEEFPDEVADRYNYVQKHKQKTDRENETS